MVILSFWNLHCWNSCFCGVVQCRTDPGLPALEFTPAGPPAKDLPPLLAKTRREGEPAAGLKEAGRLEPGRVMASILGSCCPVVIIVFLS